MTLTTFARSDEPKTPTCPIWCESPHDAGDDADYHHGAYTVIPMYQSSWFHKGKIRHEHGHELRIGLEKNDNQRHPVVIFDGALATWLTAGEAADLATLLRDFAHDLGKAFGKTVEERQTEPCWCNQEHAPGDGHHSDVKSVYLSTYDVAPGDAPRELYVMAAEPPHQRSYIELSDSHLGKVATHLLGYQAIRAADTLALLSLVVRLHDGSIR